MVLTFGLNETLLGVVFIIITPAIFKVAKDCFKKHYNKIDGYSAILTGITSLIIGLIFSIQGIYICYICNILFSNGQAKLAIEFALGNMILPFPTALFVIYLIPMAFLFIAVYTLKELIEKKYVDQSKIEKKLKQKVDKSDLEISRKTFHITIIAVIICYLFLGKILVNAIYDYISDSNRPLYEAGLSELPWHEVVVSDVMSQASMAKLLIVFIIAIICLLLIFTDFVRIYIYRFYPLKMVTYTYREREKTSLGPHIYFVFGILIVSMLLPPQPAMITIIISGLGDAFATIIGITFGKHKYKKGSSKSWEGGIGGFISSFGFSILSYFLLSPIYGGTIIKGIIMSLFGALCFLIIDYFSPPIQMSDNILNPIAIGLLTYLIYLIPI